MELMTEEKKAFKKTELGEFPEDWILKPICESTNYVDYRGATPKKVDHGITLVTAKNIKKGYINYSESKEYVEPENYDEIMSRGKPEIGDILITTEAPLGHVAAVDNTNIALAQRVIKYRAIESFLDNNYLKYFFLSDRFQENLYTNSSGSTATGIKGSVLHKLPICFPPTLEEQQAIADALSDVDKLIRSLNRLIQKKQAIKNGAMQQLLTGKKRLPGFDGEWEVKNLGDYTSLITKGTTPTSLGKSYKDKGIRFIKAESINSAGNIMHGKTAFIDEETNRLLQRSILKENDIMFSIAGVLGRTGLITVQDLPANTNQALAIIRLIQDAEISLKYLFHFLRSEFIKKHIEDINVQAAQANLSLKDVNELPIKVPPTIEEQDSIVEILSDMDRELQILRQKREKYKQIKQGMMQELLTGRTRLVKPKTEQVHKTVPKRKRSWAYEEAVIISTLIDRFNTDNFFLSRFRFVKYSYLLKRYKEMEVKDYLKKAAGPYNPQTRYGGPERIAKDKNYIIPVTSGKYKGFKPGNNIEEATGYFEDWFGTECLEWLDQFQFTKNNELELLTTVDLAIQDLKESGKTASLRIVKRLINDHDEWRPKLKREVFSDEWIQYAINKVNQLFN